MISENIIFFTILVSLIGCYSYIKAIFLGKTKPNLVSWFFWGLAPLISGFLQLKAGAHLTALPVFLSGFISVAVIITALGKRNAYWKIGVFDIYCGIFALLSIIFWLTIKEINISISFAILADIFASIPTFTKAWKFPETESPGGYVPGIINHTINLLALKKWSFSLYSFSIYMILCCVGVIFLIYRKKFTSIFLQTFGRA